MSVHKWQTLLENIHLKDSNTGQHSRLVPKVAFYTLFHRRKVLYLACARKGKWNPNIFLPLVQELVKLPAQTEQWELLQNIIELHSRICGVILKALFYPFTVLGPQPILNYVSHLRNGLLNNGREVLMKSMRLHIEPAGLRIQRNKLG